VAVVQKKEKKGVHLKGRGNGEKKERGQGTGVMCWRTAGFRSQERKRATKVGGPKGQIRLGTASEFYMGETSERPNKRFH